MRRALALAGALALAACDGAPVARDKADDGAPLLRVVYRDADAEMVLMVPDKGGRGAIRGDCAAPLLIVGQTRQVRVLSDAEVQARLKTMQLAGATRGVCP